MLRQISSRYTILPKYINPLLVFVVFFILLKATKQKIDNGNLPHFVLLIEIIVAAFLFWRAKKYTEVIMDYVGLNESTLTCRRNKVIEIISFENIRDIEFLRNNVPLIALHLKKPCRFGNEVRFVAPLKLFNFLDNELYAELRLKILNHP